MNIDLVIGQIRANMPVFGQRVAGAADFARAVEDQTWMDAPACYVIPLDEDADENPPGQGLEQHVAERIGVIVEFDNTADRRGQAASEQFEAMRTAVWACLLNWRIDPLAGAQGFIYGGGQLLSFDRARLFYQWEFVLHRLLTDADGWQEPVDTLTEIQVGTASQARPTSPGLQVQQLDTLTPPTP